MFNNLNSFKKESENILANNITNIILDKINIKSKINFNLQ